MLEVCEITNILEYTKYWDVCLNHHKKENEMIKIIYIMKK
jgi:hypothetical protein